MVVATSTAAGQVLRPVHLGGTGREGDQAIGSWRWHTPAHSAARGWPG